MTVLILYWRHRLFLLTLALLFIQACVVPVAGAAEKNRELLIGIEPEHNIFDQMQRYRALAGYLSDQLGVEVKLTIMSRYGEVAKRLESLHLDGAFLSSYTATLAIKEFGLTPVANLVRLDGESTSQGYILVRQDSGIKTVEDMRGKSVVFVDSASTEGYLFARLFFRKQGVKDMNSYFNRHYFSGSYASAVFAVLDGRADVGAAKDTVYNQLVRRDPSIQHELSIIGKSPAVPEVTFCIKSDIAPELLEKMRNALLFMGQTVEGYKILKQLEASRFISSDLSDFTVVSEMIEDVEGNADEQQ